MALLRIVKWIGGLSALAILLAALLIAAFGWNWLRGPIGRLTMERTGRTLAINGDLNVGVAWPSLIVSARQVEFANPPWAARPQMLVAAGVDLSVNLPALLGGHLRIDMAALRDGEVFLEVGASGEKNWVLDPRRQEEKSRLDVGRLVLEKSRIAYDDPASDTSLQADVANRADAAAAGLSFQARGRYKGLPVTLAGSGGPVLALRDTDTPYPFEITASAGSTRARAQGTVTGIEELASLDAEVAIAGETLADLFPLLNVALPETGPYRTAGRIVHRPGQWAYQEFTARIGSSDGQGSLQLDTSGRRPAMTGAVHFGRLDFADLGPVIGRRPKTPLPGRDKHAKEAHGVLPDRPFRTERWGKADADIRISAGTIIRNPRLPIDRLNTHLRLHDRVLTLDPLEFAVAGGKLAGQIELDGRQKPIHGRVDLAARGIVFQRLFPTVKLKAANVGKVTGKIALSGQGDSVARLLGTASGRVGLVIAGGEVSRLAMEMADLHVLESIVLKLAGDKPIRIRCGMADMEARDGILRLDQLVFDTEITNIGGSGSIDFGDERLDLTLTPESKKPALISLRSPIFVRGSFARPQVDVDKKRLVIRGLGAVALGAANPLLALAPLIETGPGEDSDCGRLLGEMRRKAS